MSRVVAARDVVDLGTVLVAATKEPTAVVMTTEFTSVAVTNNPQRNTGMARCVQMLQMLVFCNLVCILSFFATIQ